MRRRNQGTEAYHQINGEELGPMRGREPDEVCLLLSPHGGQVLACLRPPQLPSPPSGSISHPSHFFSLFCTPSYISHIPQEPPSISQSQEVTCRMGVGGVTCRMGVGGVAEPLPSRLVAAALGRRALVVSSNATLSQKAFPAALTK